MNSMQNRDKISCVAPVSTPCCVQAPWARPDEGQIQEDEAVERRGVAAVQNREERSGRVHHKVADRHLAREQEGNGPGEQAKQYEQAAEEFENPGNPQ